MAYYGYKYCKRSRQSTRRTWKIVEKVEANDGKDEKRRYFDGKLSEFFNLKHRDPQGCVLSATHRYRKIGLLKYVDGMRGKGWN